MKALFDFEAMQEGDLSFRQGDKLIVTVEYATTPPFIYSVCLSVCLSVGLSVSLGRFIHSRWLGTGSRVVSVLDSGAEGPGSNRSHDAVVNSLRQTVHQAAKFKMVAAVLRVAGVTTGPVESNGSLPSGS